jgi:hypothetical protein
LFFGDVSFLIFLIKSVGSSFSKTSSKYWLSSYFLFILDWIGASSLFLASLDLLRGNSAGWLVVGGESYSYIAFCLFFYKLLYRISLVDGLTYFMRINLLADGGFPISDSAWDYFINLDFLISGSYYFYS